MTTRRAASMRVEEEIGNAGVPPQDNQVPPQDKALVNRPTKIYKVTKRVL